MYAKIKNGSVLKFPYTQADLQADYPGSSVPSEWSELFKESQGIVNVVVTGLPDHPDTHVCDGMWCAYNANTGQWETTWSIRPLTDEEIALRADEIRAQRNNKLSRCDWTQVLDAQVDRAAWATYRQELRDVTKQSRFPYSVEWPQEPQ